MRQSNFKRGIAHAAFAILFYLCCIGQTVAQTTISGKVINRATGQPVEGANIRVDNSLTGCVSNGKGVFSIGNLPEGEHLLSVTHISFMPRALRVEGNSQGIVIELEESLRNVGQVVVTGTGTHHRASDSPVPVAVLVAKELRDASATSLEDALTKLTPNFSFSTNGMGTTLSMNGLSQDYVLVLENGKRLAGDDTYARIDPSNIKRIELLSGAASALYGSDAIGGVINIITEDAKNTVSVSSDSRYASKGRFTQSVNADVNTGSFGSYTSYQRRQADGWQLNPYEESKDGELEPTDKEASTAFHTNAVNQRFTFSTLDNRLSLYLRGAYFNSANDRPVSEYKYNILHENYTYGAGAQYIISKGKYLNADFFSDNFRSDYDYIQKSGSFLPGDKETRKQSRYNNANVRGIFDLGTWNKLSVGAEYVGEYLRSESDEISGRTMYTLALFAQDEIRLPWSLRAVVGVRYLYNENFGSHATPNLSLMYQSGGLNVRGSYAAGFRTPTLSQLYATSVTKASDRLTIGNPNLQPEKSDYLTLNAEYTVGHLSFTFTGYLNKLRDMINYRTLSPEEAAEYGHDEVRRRDNIDRARVRGIHLAARWNVGAGLSLNAGYSLADAKDLSRDEPIDKSVRHAGNVNLLWERGWKSYRLHVSLNGRIQGERYSQTYGYAPKYQLWDLNTRHSFYVGNFVLEPGVGIENIFNFQDDRPWNSNYATLSPGRSLYASLSLRFRQ